MKINQVVNEDSQICPECGGPAFSDLLLAEKKDACYNKVRSRYKVWPSAYASGALVQCRKKGAANWGNKSKNESVEEEQELYGLRIGDTVKTEINGQLVQGDVIDIFPDAMEVELLLRGPNSGQTVTVDVRDTEALNEQGLVEDWREAAEEMGEWAEYVRTKLLKTPKQQRWAVAKQLSQIEVKNFGSQLVQFKKYDNKTGQPIASDASESHFTQIVQDTLRALNTKPVTGGVALDLEPSEIHKPDDRGGKDWVVDTKMGWLVVPNAGQAPGRVKRLLWKAFNAGPEIYPLALDVWEETGDFTEQDYKDIIIKAAELRNSGGLEAQAYRDYASQGLEEGSELDKFKNKSGKFPEPRERKPGQAPSKSETLGKDGKIYHWQDPRANQDVAEGEREFTGANGPVSVTTTPGRTVVKRKEWDDPKTGSLGNDGKFHDPDFAYFKSARNSDYDSGDYSNDRDLGEGDKVGNMDADKFDAAISRLKKLAGAGPLKTVWDPQKRVYKNVPVAQQPGDKK